MRSVCGLQEAGQLYVRAGNENFLGGKPLLELSHL